MYEKTVTITAKHGIHTRPAALLVKEAKQYDCDVMVECQANKPVPRVCSSCRHWGSIKACLSEYLPKVNRLAKPLNGCRNC